MANLDPSPSSLLRKPSLLFDYIKDRNNIEYEVPLGVKCHIKVQLHVL